ncbi:hypothetical protein GEMRC1_004495 [Eukaryota sp. GEM-RC1]
MDIKPANILLVNDGVRIADFGTSKNLESTTSVSKVHALTTKYAAPEQFDNVITPLIDVYALGLVLYELLSNKEAYAGYTMAGMMGDLHEFLLSTKKQELSTTRVKSSPRIPPTKISGEKLLVPSNLLTSTPNKDPLETSNLISPEEGKCEKFADCGPNVINSCIQSDLSLNRITLTDQKPLTNGVNERQIISPSNHGDQCSKIELLKFEVGDCSPEKTENLPNSNLLKYKEELNSLPLKVKALIPSEVVESRLTTLKSCETIVDQHPTKVRLLLDELSRDSFSIWLTALKESRILNFFSKVYILVDGLLLSSNSTFNVSRACLSYCYLKGIGCEKNEGKVISYYSKIPEFEKEKNIMSRFWTNEVRSWISSRTRIQDLAKSYHSLVEGVSLSSAVKALLPNENDINHLRESVSLIDSRNLDLNPSNTLLSECQVIWEGIQRHLDFLSSIKLVTSRFEDLLSFFKSRAFTHVTLKNECNSNNIHKSVLKLFTAFCYAHNLASSPSIENVYRALDDVSLINHFPSQDNELISYRRRAVEPSTVQHEQNLTSTFKKCCSDIRPFSRIIKSSLLKFVPADLTLRVNFIHRTFNVAQEKFSTQSLSQKYVSVVNLEKQVVKALEILQLFDFLKKVPFSPSMTLFDYLTNTSFIVYTLTRSLQTDQSQQTREIVYSLLAFLYLKGIGTSQNYLEAGKYYQLLSPLEQEPNAIVSFWKEEVTKELIEWLKRRSDLLKKSESLKSAATKLTVPLLKLLPNEEAQKIKDWYVRVSQFGNDVEYHYSPSWNNLRNIAVKLENQWNEFFHFSTGPEVFETTNPTEPLNSIYGNQTVAPVNKFFIKCCLSFCYAQGISVSPSPSRAKSLFDELEIEFINQTHGILVQYWIHTLTSMYGSRRVNQGVNQRQSLHVNNSLHSVKFSVLQPPESLSFGNSFNRTDYFVTKPSRPCTTSVSTN